MAAENGGAPAKYFEMGHYRAVCGEPDDGTAGLVDGTAADVGFGAMRNVFDRHARLGRRKHAGLLYGLFQAGKRQRKWGIGRVPIHHRRKRGAVGNAAAQWFCVGDGGHDAGFDGMRDCVAVALLASGLEGKR